MFSPTHISVLVSPILEAFSQIAKEEPAPFFVDGTAGEGGHTLSILQNIPTSRVLLVDRDPVLLARAKERLYEAGMEGRCFFWEGNFSKLQSEILLEQSLPKPSGILVDLGICTYHFVGSGRGFSFKEEENLDMRLDPVEGRFPPLSASDWIQTKPLSELERIFYQYGEERWTKKIVERIGNQRKKEPIRTTRDLAKLVEASIPRKFWPDHSHPSFRVFQALRIAVNSELDHIESGLPSLYGILREGGVLLAISFHSLEDRLVKHGFLKLKAESKGELLWKKPILPSEEEVETNPASRSAKLRGIQKLPQKLYSNPG